LNKKGFTLTEILIALSIASIISIGFFQVINMTIKTNSKNEKDIKSLNIAQTEIESLRAQIKNATNDNKNIKIYIDKDENRKFIDIDSKNSWIKNEQGIEKIKVNEEKYQGEGSNGEKDSSLLKYKKVPNKDETAYIITLGLSREEITNNQVYNKYLYTININVEFENKNISKKNTVISTKILENS
jgi:prepilin-type N-terminal cleavage/methylation domain-containing protein